MPTVTDGDGGASPRRAARGVPPWPNAAQRAAAGAADGPAGATPSVEAPVVPAPARPRVEPDHESLLGITRRSHGRAGSRLFVGFFLFVYLLILVQLVVVLLSG